MNMFLHNIGEIDGEAMISPNDASSASPKSLPSTRTEITIPLERHLRAGPPRFD